MAHLYLLSMRQSAVQGVAESEANKTKNMPVLLIFRWSAFCTSKQNQSKGEASMLRVLNCSFGKHRKVACTDVAWFGCYFVCRIKASAPSFFYNLSCIRASMYFMTPEKTTCADLSDVGVDVVL